MHNNENEKEMEMLSSVEHRTVEEKKKQQNIYQLGEKHKNSPEIK